MSLVNRVSLFFLAALALVLAGFSAAVYALAARHASAQLDARLSATLDALCAAAEVKPEGVEWEPGERRVAVGGDPGPEGARWSVHAADGHQIDGSANAPYRDSWTPGGPDWRRSLRAVRSDGSRELPADAAASLGFGPPPADRVYHGGELVFVAAASERPRREGLRDLALILAAVSGVTWLVAAAGGRWLCKRALGPVGRMAASARGVRTDAAAPRLDVPATGDELEDLGRAFNALLADLGDALERQTRFAGDASHQLRTPLTALLASVEVALRQNRDPAEYRRVLEVVQRRGSQLRSIIELLLRLARPEAPAEPAEPLDLAAWLPAWLAAWGDHPRAADLALDLGTPAAWVRADPAVLTQVLDTLIDNALKYSQPGTPVAVGLSVAERRVTLAVTDQGCGVDAADLPHLGEPFFRAQSARWLGKPGVGLGLAVVRRLVRELAAELQVESRPGIGSRFGVTLAAIDAV